MLLTDTDKNLEDFHVNKEKMGTRYKGHAIGPKVQSYY